MMVDVYKWRKSHPNDTPPSAVYSGHYVGHDNNRDAMGLTLEALAERAEHLPWLEGAGAARPARVGVVPLRQHRRQRPLQRLARPDPDQRVAPDRLEQRERDDAHGHAGRLRVGNVRHLVAGLLMFFAALHNGISRLYETYGNGGSADTEERTLSAERDGAHLVPAEPAHRARALVAPQQQQLRADRDHRLAQLLRQQPRQLPEELLRQEQAVDPEAEGRGAGGVRAAGQRGAPGGAGRAAACAAAAGRGDLTRDRGVHGHAARAARAVRRPGWTGRAGRGFGIRDATACWRGACGWGGSGGSRASGRGGSSRRGAAGRRRSSATARRAAGEAGRDGETRRAREAGPASDPRVSRRQFHHPHGPAVLAHRRRAARLPVPGRRTTRRPGRTTTPGGRFPRRSACRPSVSPT